MAGSMHNLKHQVSDGKAIAVFHKLMFQFIDILVFPICVPFIGKIQLRLMCSAEFASAGNKVGVDMGFCGRCDV